jgi:hypothetical protein
MQQVRTQLPPQEQEELSKWERRGSGFTRGVAEGLTRLRSSLLALLEARGLPIDDQTRHWITTCSDLDTLGDAIVRAATITTTDELLP